MSMPPTPVDVCADTCLPGSTMHIRNVGIARVGLAGRTTRANCVGDSLDTAGTEQFSECGPRTNPRYNANLLPSCHEVNRDPLDIQCKPYPRPYLTLPTENCT